MTQLAVVFEDKEKDRYEAITLKGLDISLEALIRQLGLDRNALNKTYELIYIEKTGEKRRLGDQKDFGHMMHTYKKPFCHIFCQPRAYRNIEQGREANEIIEQQNRRIYMLEQELDQANIRNRNNREYIIELEQRVQHYKYTIEKTKRSQNNLYVCDPPEMDTAMNFVIKVKQRYMNEPHKFTTFVRMAQKQKVEELVHFLKDHPDLQHELGTYFKSAKGMIRMINQQFTQQQQQQQQQQQPATQGTEVHYPTQAQKRINYTEGQPAEVYHSQHLQQQFSPPPPQQQFSPPAPQQQEESIHNKLISMGYCDRALNDHLIASFKGDVNAIVDVLRAYNKFVWQG